MTRIAGFRVGFAAQQSELSHRQMLSVATTFLIVPSSALFSDKRDLGNRLAQAAETRLLEFEFPEAIGNK